MIVALSTNTPKRILHVGNEVPWVRGGGSLASTQGELTNIVGIVRNMPPERRNYQVDMKNTGKKMDVYSKMNWREDLTVSDEYLEYPHKTISMPE